MIGGKPERTAIWIAAQLSILVGLGERGHGSKKKLTELSDGGRASEDEDRFVREHVLPAFLPRCGVVERLRGRVMIPEPDQCRPQAEGNRCGLVERSAG